jgi:hypothetical protein
MKDFAQRRKGPQRRSLLGGLGEALRLCAKQFLAVTAPIASALI